jgi:hypothetical protein
MQFIISIRRSSVRIVLDYDPDDRGSIPDRGKGFSSSLCVQTGSGVHPALYSVGTRRSRGWDMTLTTHPHLAPWSGSSSTIQMPPRRKRDSFTFNSQFQNLFLYIFFSPEPSKQSLLVPICFNQPFIFNHYIWILHSSYLTSFQENCKIHTKSYVPTTFSYFAQNVLSTVCRKVKNTWMIKSKNKHVTRWKPVA